MPETARIQNPEEGVAVHTDLSNEWNDIRRMEALGALKRLAAEKRVFLRKEKLIHQGIINQGGMIEQLKNTLALMDTDPKAIEKAEREQIACFRVADLPIGKQMGFFEGPASAVEQIDDAKRAYNAGYADGCEGKNADEQRYPPGTQLGEHYLSGWNEAQGVLRVLFQSAMEQAIQPTKTAAEIAAEKLKAKEAKAEEKRMKEAAKAKAAEDKKSEAAKAKADKLAEKAAKAKEAADAAAKEVGGEEADQQVDIEAAIDDVAQEMPPIPAPFRRSSESAEAA